MTKLLIGIKGCHFDHDRGAYQLIRDTWGQDVPSIGADLIFFTGREGTKAHHTRQPDPDEVFIDAPDDYKSLPLKTRAITKYALAQGYDFEFLCDTGSFVVPHHLLFSGFENHDYTGYWGMRLNPFPYTAQDSKRGCPQIYFERCYPWASGGGYVLSHKAMEIIANNEPIGWAEDLSVGQVLAAHGIKLTDLSRSSFKGHSVDWIHNEKNEEPGALDRRRNWMTQRYNEVKEHCSQNGCAPPIIPQNVALRAMNSGQRIDKPEPAPDPIEIERILEERRQARRNK